MNTTGEATLTSKGQTTIPRAIREGLGMHPGDRMTFTLMADGVVTVRVKKRRLSLLGGMLRRPGSKPVPAEELSR